MPRTDAREGHGRTETGRAGSLPEGTPLPCNLCGSTNKEYVGSRDEHRYGLASGFRLVRCTECNLVYLDPRPAPDEMPAYYPPEYQEAMREVARDVRKSRIGRIAIQMIRRNRVAPLPAPGRVLDVGCASGDYLLALRREGWDVHGIEIDDGAAEYAREKLGLPVRTGRAEEALSGFPDDHFEAVTMWHVLEHLYDPAQALREVHRILKPGGTLLLELPNLKSWSAYLFGRQWFPLEIPRHLFHYTPESLTALLTKTGFQVRRLTSVPAPAEIVWTLQSMWERWVRKEPSGRLLWSPVLLALSFPPCWVAARFMRATFMGVVAVKPS